MPGYSEGKQYGLTEKKNTWCTASISFLDQKKSTKNKRQNKKQTKNPNHKPSQITTTKTNSN